MKVNGLLVKWNHQKNNDGIFVRTKCSIENENHGTIATGFACRNLKHDEWNRAVGRKLSLTRALEQSGLDKQSRSQVWDTYFNKESLK